MVNTQLKFVGLGLLAAATWLAFGSSGTAAAATQTWTGADCPATDCHWSNVNNWQSGVAPVNGDDIVINATTTNPDSFETTYNDISNLSVHNISISGYATSQNSYMSIANTSGNATPLTITGNVTYTIPSTAAPSGWYPALSLLLTHGTLILGADSTFTDVRTNSADTINLNGHALSYVRNLSSVGQSASTMSLDSLITGNGTLNIDVPLTIALYMNGVNTYSGVTNINSVDLISSLDVPNVGTFGTSVVNLSSQGRILFRADGAQTISNTINITPPTVTGTFLSNQLEFWSATAPVTYTVPSINLLGNARFGVNNVSGAVAVNLAGITTNGYCIQYGDDNSDVAYFSNGPSACVVSVASTPNTGFALLSSNPLLVFAATLVASASLALLGKKAFFSKR